VDASRVAARGGDGGALCDHEHTHLRHQQRHSKICRQERLRPEFTDLDLHSQYTPLRQPGERKLSGAIHHEVLWRATFDAQRTLLFPEIGGCSDTSKRLRHPADPVLPSRRSTICNTSRSGHAAVVLMEWLPPRFDPRAPSRPSRRHHRGHSSDSILTGWANTWNDWLTMRCEVRFGRTQSIIVGRRGSFGQSRLLWRCRQQDRCFELAITPGRNLGRRCSHSSIRSRP